MKGGASFSLFPFPLLTARGAAVLAAPALIPLSGLLLDLPFSLVFEATVAAFGALLCAAVISYLGARRFVRRCTVDLALPKVLFSGVPATLSCTFRSKGVYRMRPRQLELRPELPATMDALPTTVALTLPLDGEPHSAALQVTPRARGKALLHRLHARVLAPGGLCRWQCVFTLPAPVEVMVYPDPGVAELRSPRAFQALQAGEVQLEMRGRGGREFDRLRLYTPGDDLRKVDWKRSARGGGLLVKVYRPETHQRVTIVIDCSRRMGNRVENRLQLEFATDAAARLLRMAERYDDEVGLFAFNHEVQARIPCRRGKRQERLIMETLSSLTVGSLEPDYQLLTEWAQLSRRRSLMVLITSISTPASFDTIRKALMPIRSRHLPLMFALADRDLQGLVKKRAHDLSEAYVIGAGMAELSEVRTRAQQLTRSGVDCVYCDVTELSESLRQKYYELKLSGKL